ncbi:MAG: MFS transporter [Thermodesulfobacteriota bacterium]
MLKVSHLSGKLAVGAQYFVYFGVMGIFLPYFNLYCYHLGFNGFQIGVLSALRSMALILFPLIWGGLADRYQKRRAIYIGCTFMSAGLWAFYLFTADFRLMVILTIFYGIFYAPIISFLEAFSMEVLGHEKNSYGQVRAWGSISFIGIVVGVGKIIELYPIRMILWLILTGSALMAVISFGIPEVRKHQGNSFRKQIDAFLNRRVTVFLLCGFLMLVSHGAYYGFFSIHLEKLGYGSTFIGASWALASIAEIMVMIASNRIFRRFSQIHVLFFSFMAAALRWLALYYVRSPLSILATQVLHAFSYGTFHMASILYIDLLTPIENKTLGQAVNNAVSYGTGLMIGFLISGYLYERLDTAGLFLISSLIAAAGGVLIKGFVLKNGHDNPLKNDTLNE